MTDSATEEVYKHFWKPLIEPDGKLDMEQLKRELYDFWLVMQNVPKVYCHVTGGQVSKILTDPKIVNSLADEFYDRILLDDSTDELGKTIVPQFDASLLPHIADMQDRFKASDDEAEPNG